MLGFEGGYVLFGRDFRFMSCVIILGICLFVLFELVDFGFGVELKVRVFVGVVKILFFLVFFCKCKRKNSIECGYVNIS